MPSTESCSPRLCWGFTTQWLLVAVMSNTSHPSSAAQIVLESSRNKSESLEQRSRVPSQAGFALESPGESFGQGTGLGFWQQAELCWCVLPSRITLRGSFSPLQKREDGLKQSWGGLGSLGCHSSTLSS